MSERRQMDEKMVIWFFRSRFNRRLQCVGYVSYQKHEGEVFKQNIEKKMPVDQINAHAKSYKEDATNVNNDMSLGQMLSIQKEAIEMGVNKQVFAQIQIPALGLALPIFKGANQYTLSLGAATYFYEDAEMGKGNYVLAGHNMECQVFYFLIFKSCH